MRRNLRILLIAAVLVAAATTLKLSGRVFLNNLFAIGITKGIEVVDLERQRPVQNKSSSDQSFNVSSQETNFSSVQSSPTPDISLTQGYPYPYIPECCKGDNTWRATCFTKNACDNPAFPFQSIAEKAMFPRLTVTRSVSKLIRRKCESFDTEVREKLNAGKCVYDKIDLSTVPSQCTAAGMWGGHTSAFSHAMVFPAGKLMFCGIPKTGITRWLQFLRFYIGANDYQSFPHFKKDRLPLLLDAMEIEVQEKLLNDPEWTKAVFIRHPLDRVLSGYLDKVVSGQTKPLAKNTTFAEFIQYLEKEGKGDGWGMDPHFRPQILYCGLYKWLPQFDFVGSFDNLATETKSLLNRVGLWEQYGKKYQNTKGKGGRISAILPPKVNETDSTGFQQVNVAFFSHEQHAKDSRSKFYTPELEKRVLQLYSKDYQLYQILKSCTKNTGSCSSGKELASRFCAVPE